MNRLASLLVGTCLESWQELRVNRGRVVLSLIGVTIAVASLAVVVGFGSLTERASDQIDQQVGGRPATYGLTASTTDGGTVPDEDRLAREYRAAAERYHVRWLSEATPGERKVQFPDGVQTVQQTVVDPTYAEMHGVDVVSGSWFDDADRDRLAPALVVNRPFLDALGGVDVAAHPTVALPGSPTRTAVVIGVVGTSQYDTTPSMYVLADSAATADVSLPEGAVRTWEVWLPPRGGKAIAERIGSDAERSFDGAIDVQVDRIDAGGFVDADPLGPIRAVIAGVSVLVLLLGGIGLLNVSLVSVRQRVREIGIRRGVGASAGRVFVAVMLENVLGTLVAGAVGVMVGAAVLGNETVRDAITTGVDVGGVAFPLDAALVGVGSALVVGVVSGVLPALVAIRVKVIDAIRF